MTRLWNPQAPQSYLRVAEDPLDHVDVDVLLAQQSPSSVPGIVQPCVLPAGRDADVSVAAAAAPTGGGQCRGASAKSWLESRSAATRPSARPAASRRATPVTPDPATSTANEPSAARAGPPRADGAAPGSRRPSTTPPAATGPAPTRPGSRRGRSASSPQAEDHRTPARTKTCPPGTVRVTEPTASRKASAQVAQVFGTHISILNDTGQIMCVPETSRSLSWQARI